MKYALTFLALFYAVGAMAEAAAPAGQGGITPFIPLILIFAIFYFLVLRPQQKKQKEHQKYLAEMKRGDMVVTNAGIVGTIRTLSEKFVTLEIDEGVCMKVLRSHISEGANALKDENKSRVAPGQMQESKT